MTWICEWCDTNSEEAVYKIVSKYPERCRRMNCRKCKAITWHAPMKDLYLWKVNEQPSFVI